LAKWFEARTENARKSRKKMIVALARKLLIPYGTSSAMASCLKALSSVRHTKGGPRSRNT
jgi:hypothetical protein